MEVLIDPGALEGFGIGGRAPRGLPSPPETAAKAASAASIPDFIALCEPLIRGTLTKPAEQPISAPPGNTSFGIDCSPPSLIARAP